jgi:hypothetical protein
MNFPPQSVMMMVPQAKPSKLKAVAGVLNPETLIDVWTDTSFIDKDVVKLNRLTILAYKEIEMPETKIYKLWTSGGFEFFTNNDKFKSDDDEKENKDLEAGKS